MKIGDTFVCDFCGERRQSAKLCAAESGPAICYDCVSVARRILEMQGRFPDLEIKTVYVDEVEIPDDGEHA